MPTYEYVCAKCEHQFEKFQPISENALTVCPKEDCGQKRWGKGKVKRLIGAGAGLLFKGSGFYITDYRSDSYKAAAKKDSPESSSASGSASAGSSSGDAKTGGASGKSEPAKPAPKPSSKPADS